MSNLRFHSFLHTGVLAVFISSSVQSVTAGQLLTEKYPDVFVDQTLTQVLARMANQEGSAIAGDFLNFPEDRVLDSIELPAGFQYPNGIARASNGTLYVGSITSGQIVRINPKGDSETFFAGSDEVFAGTALRLDEPRGILWGTSADFLGVPGPNGETIRRPHRIFAIDTRTGKLLRVILMPEDGYGNDIALDANGGVYLTDTARSRIYYLAPGADRLQVWAEDARFTFEGVGPGGIARQPNGVTIVGLYSSGELFKVTQEPQGTVKVEAIPLERNLENPDGIQFAPDGSLLVVEAAVASGDGRLVRIDVLSPGSQPKPIETIAAGIESPANLTVDGRNVWVTESRIRHRILPGREQEIPDRFFVRRFTLPHLKQQPYGRNRN